MTDITSNTSIVKLSTGNLARYSNSLVRRAVEDIGLRSPETIRFVSQTKNILVIGNQIGELLVQILQSEGYHTTFAPLEGYETIFVKAHSIPSGVDILSEPVLGTSNMVIIANWKSFELLLAIRTRYPSIKTIFLNTYRHELDEIAKQKGVDAVFRENFEIDQLVDTINDIILR